MEVCREVETEEDIKWKQAETGNGSCAVKFCVKRCMPYYITQTLHSCAGYFHEIRAVLLEIKLEFMCKNSLINVGISLSMSFL